MSLRFILGTLDKGVRYAIFGTGSYAMGEVGNSNSGCLNLLKRTDRTFVGFIDRSVDENKDKFFDYPVFPEERIGQLGLDYVIVLSMFHNEVLGRMERFKSAGVRFLSPTSIDLNDMYGDKKQESRQRFNHMLDAVDLNVEVLLVNPPACDSRFPNVGMGFIDEALRTAGIGVRTVDLSNLMIKSVAPAIRELWQPYNGNFWQNETMFSAVGDLFSDFLNDFVHRIDKSAVKVVGISASLYSRLFSILLCRRIKTNAPGKKVVFGGFEVFSLNACLTYPDDTADAFVVTEGELSFTQLLVEFEHGRSGVGIPGVYIPGRADDFIPPVVVHDLNSLQFPRYLDIDVSNYGVVGDRRVFLCATRGCVWKQCTFCSDSHNIAGYRMRKPEDIIAEIRYNVDNHNIEGFIFSDETFNSNMTYMERFCTLIAEEGLKVKLDGQGRITRQMTPEVLRKMKQAGFNYITYGLESGSDKVIADMKKGFDAELAARLLRDTHEAGIRAAVNFIVGYPAEDEIAFAETLEFLRKNAKYINAVNTVSICRVNKGSPLYANYANYGIVDPDNSLGWRTADGKNTLEIRICRAATIERLITELEIARDYSGSGVEFQES
ncbi:radical SAM/B12 binding domain-containing protein [Candidatus Magnetobacterium bavaricum]|uniref:Radical SAM/B12 binding domain-containing protein n=1 Tax=Candidatus Magnetobacterium bavaricum TaxID=29290 RepID=A0A0F3GRV9_9BACT|nr:radical SAM/B12 binding domain-containing protein [Candidatus Magnetobacterium bavaricum]